MFGGPLGAFLDGAIWLAAVIALGFTGWRATKRGVFRAVSESYYGRKAQAFGGVCLGLAVIAGVVFTLSVLGYLTRGIGISGLFFFAGAAVGGWFTYRYYMRTA